MNDTHKNDDLTHRFVNRRLRCVHNRFAGDFHFSRERGESRHRRNIVLEQALLQELREVFHPRGTPVKGDMNEHYASFTWHGVPLSELQRYDAKHLADFDSEELEMAHRYGSCTQLHDADGNVTSVSFDRDGRIRRGSAGDSYERDDYWNRGYDDDYGYADSDLDDLDWRLGQYDEGLDDGPEDDEEPEEESLFESESRRFDHAIVYTHDNWY